jgi:uncharacterized membrane protein
MRTLLRSRPLVHFLILAIPVVAIVYGMAAGSRASAAPAFQTASDWFLTVGAGIAVTSVGMGWVLRRRPYDERVIWWQLNTFLAGVELMIDSFSFQLAVALPVAGVILIAVPAAWLAVWSIPRFRRTRFVSSFVVQRSPQVVFEFVSDLRNLPRWRTEVESVEMLTPKPIGPGSRFRQRGRVPKGLEVVGVEQIVDFEPYRRMTSKAEFALPNLDEITFEPVGDSTRVTLRFDIELSFSSAATGGRFRQPGRNRQLMSLRNAGAERLKQILEGGKAGRSRP